MNTAEALQEIKRSFRLYMNGPAAQSMRQKGLNYKLIWGVSLTDLKEIAKEYKFEIADKPSLPLGTQIGLKPVVLLVIGLAIYGQIPSRKKKKED